MSFAAMAHGALGFVVLLLAVPAAWRAEERSGRWAARASGVAALLTLALGVALHPRWALGTRSAIALASQSAARWLDRKELFGFASLCFAVAAALCSLDGRLASRAQRAAAVASAGFAALALVHLAFALARVPPAMVD